MTYLQSYDDSVHRKIVVRSSVGSNVTVEVNQPWKTSASHVALEHLQIVIRESIITWFNYYANIWTKETSKFSSTKRLESHPMFNKIVELGAPVVPHILKEMINSDVYWFPVLRAITGEDPVPDHIRGKFDEMRQAWLDWGKGRGLI